MENNQQPVKEPKVIKTYLFSATIELEALDEKDALTLVSQLLYGAATGDKQNVKANLNPISVFMIHKTKERFE